MEITRINTYDDPRFREKILKQHGAFLINGNAPCEVEIISSDSAVIHYKDTAAYDTIMKEFRYFAGHIIRFYNEKGILMKAFPPVNLFRISLKEIQPTQFYVDEKKLAAAETFVNGPEDVVIPLLYQDGRYLSCDGHTRLYLAWQKGFDEVLGFLNDEDDILLLFAGEAAKRGILTVMDMEKISHEEYGVKWNQFCEDFFLKLKETEHQA